MVNRADRQVQRYMLHLTAPEMADLIWAANQGAEQVFGYTDPGTDWGMTQAEFDAWYQRVARVIAIVEVAATEGQVLP
jgi:hypothetical protein